MRVGWVGVETHFCNHGVTAVFSDPVGDWASWSGLKGICACGDG